MTQNNKQEAGRPRKYYDKGELKSLTELKRAEIKRVMHAEGLSTGDDLAIDLLASSIALVELIDRWLQDHDIFTDEYEGAPQPILKTRLRTVNSIARMLNDLGLTPAARARQKAKLGSPTDLASQIQREKRGETK